MIYYELLVARKLVRPRVLVPRRGISVVIPGHEVTIGIDASILRSCRLASDEATWMLYRYNELLFVNANEIADFRSGGLRMKSVAAGQNGGVELQPFYNSGFNPYGRLAMLGVLRLVFTDCSEGPELYLHRGSVLPLSSTRESVIGAWSRLLAQNPDANPNERLSFPALRDLRMDFSRLGLREDEGVVVC